MGVIPAGGPRLQKVTDVSFLACMVDRTANPFFFGCARELATSQDKSGCWSSPSASRASISDSVADIFELESEYSHPVSVSEQSIVSVAALIGVGLQLGSRGSGSGRKILLYPVSYL